MSNKLVEQAPYHPGYEDVGFDLKKGTKEMRLEELIEALDQRYGNPHAKECHLIHKAIAELRRLQSLEDKK
jgi:hypothetical protein